MSIEKEYTTRELAFFLDISFYGVSKGIKAGLINAKKDDKGRWKITHLEAQRVKSELIKLDQ